MISRGLQDDSLLAVYASIEVEDGRGRETIICTTGQDAVKASAGTSGGYCRVQGR